MPLDEAPDHVDLRGRRGGEAVALFVGGSGVLASRVELLALSISGRLRVLEDMTVKLIEVAGAE